MFGGNGFIGSHFVDQLVEWGHDVTVMDRFSSGTEKYGPRAVAAVRKVRGDYTDQEAAAAGLAGAEIAYNFISASTPITSWDDPVASVQKDVIQALGFFERCVACGVAKVVYISSGGTIYGPQDGVVDENTLPRPFNPHAVCKLAVEHFLNHYRMKYGLQSDVYRVGNVFGPRQSPNRPQGVIGVWMKRILDGLPLDVYGDETTRRDYMYVQDVAKLLGHSLIDLGSSDTFNVGTGSGISILGLLDIFKQVVEVPFEYRISPRRPSDNTNAVLCSEKLRSRYPDFAFHDLPAMILKTWDYFKAEAGRNG